MTKSRRECGSCSLCCKLMDVPEVKPRHDWCPHARPGQGGCAIYQHRPELCREFHCMWLIDEKLPDYWYPAKSKIVISAAVDGAVSFIVDPAYPLRWREEPYFSDIKRIAQIGIGGKLGVRWVTFILVGDQEIPVIKPSRPPPAPGSGPSPVGDPPARAGSRSPTG